MLSGYSRLRFAFIVLLLTLTACTSDVKAPVASSNNAAVKNTRASTSSQNEGYHIVKKGDTLYSIAWRYGEDFKEVARWNNITPPYLIYPDQVLRLKPLPVTVQRIEKPPVKNVSRENRSQPVTRKTVTQPANRTGRIDWHWPTAGEIVKINLPTLQKGLNISGKFGQEIKAAAAGEVVYSGSGLLGYGKLIIIKHSETYLSAYAHNDRILIKEGMKVTTGQKIATMGTGSNGAPLLHFEIRKDGKPVDPIQFLPRQRS